MSVNLDNLAKGKFKNQKFEISRFGDELEKLQTSYTITMNKTVSIFGEVKKFSDQVLLNSVKTSSVLILFLDNSEDKDANYDITS